MIHTIEETITRLRQIQLDSEHSPEQILHMILAGGTSQSIYNIQQGIHQSAPEFLCRETGNIRNYPIAGGIIHRDQNGPYFIRGTPHFPVDQHSNQFLGTLAVAGVNFKGTRIWTDRGAEGTSGRYGRPGDEGLSTGTQHEFAIRTRMVIDAFLHICRCGSGMEK